MVQKADRSDHVRTLALAVKTCYDRKQELTQEIVSGTLLTSSNNVSSSAWFKFSPPAQAGARFGAINVQYDEWSEYIDPIVYSLHDQQLIQNWNNVRNLTFSGDGLVYMQCINCFILQNGQSSSGITWCFYIAQPWLSHQSNLVELYFP